MLNSSPPPMELLRSVKQLPVAMTRRCGVHAQDQRLDPTGEADFALAANLGQNLIADEALHQL